jgi:hypothetical protein
MSEPLKHKIICGLTSTERRMVCNCGYVSYEIMAIYEHLRMNNPHEYCCICTSTTRCADHQEYCKCTQLTGELDKKTNLWFCTYCKNVLDPVQRPPPVQVEEFKLDPKLLPMKQKYYNDDLDITEQVIDTIKRCCGDKLRDIFSQPTLGIEIEINEDNAISSVMENLISTFKNELNIDVQPNEFTITYIPKKDVTYCWK